MSSRTNREPRAFTLIELLIVIAIIAILALIAVPNFLEAQVRAKVSKVYADQRTCATALEAYAVDWGRTPIGMNEGVNRGMWASSDNHLRGLHTYGPLTTPVAYLTSIPKDAFIDGNARHDGTRTWQVFFYDTIYRPESANPTVAAAKKGYIWFVRSWGPTRKGSSPWVWTFLNNGKTENIYDASNGTISRGFITRTNQGLVTGAGN